jgi:ABC-2 type transport system ATP-binding protein
VTSHILPELARVCHRIAILAKGRLRAYGTMEEIARQLSPQRTMEVLLTRSEEVTRAAEIIQKKLDPGSEVSPSATESAVRFRTALAEEELGRILAELVSAGVGVTQFREVQTDLEAAFMSVASGESTSQAGGGSP